MEITPYTAGLDAGHKYFRDGVDHLTWVYPEVSPFPKSSNEDILWWKGFDHGSGDAEAAYESDLQ